jgi:hypothetical protein
MNIENKIHLEFAKACINGNKDVVIKLSSHKFIDTSVGLNYSYLSDKLDIFKYLLSIDGIDISDVIISLWLDNKLYLIPNIEKYFVNASPKLAVNVCIVGDLGLIEKVFEECIVQNISYVTKNYKKYDNKTTDYLLKEIIRQDVYTDNEIDTLCEMAVKINNIDIFNELIDRHGLRVDFDFDSIILYNRIDFVKPIVDLGNNHSNKLLKYAIVKNAREIIDRIFSIHPDIFRSHPIFAGTFDLLENNHLLILGISYIFYKGIKPNYYEFQIGILLERGIDIEQFCYSEY